MNKTQAKRLLKLAAFLRTVPRSQFDYSITKCGSKACAIGWMPAVFPRLCKYGAKNHYEETSVTLREKPTSSFETAQIVFGLHEWQSEELFNPYENDLPVDSTPKQVAAHIEKFVTRAMLRERQKQQPKT